MRQLRQPHRIGLEPVGNVMRGSLSLERRIHRKHHFIDTTRRDTRDKAVDGQILGPHAIERRQAPAKHMKPPRKQPRAFERPQICHVLDHCNRAVITTRIGTDATGIGRVDVAACRTLGKPLVDPFQCPQQRHQRTFALFEQMQHRAPCRPWPQSGEPGKGLRKRFDFGRGHVSFYTGQAELVEALCFLLTGCMRIIFMGTPDFAVPSLHALVAAGHQVVGAYSQPPRRAGRGKSLTPSPVQMRAEAFGIDVRHPVSLRNAEEQAAFAALNADIAVVAAYGLILPQAILDAPRHGCINVHASLLPRWRGAAPIHRAILAADQRTGVTIMQMEAGLDTGPMLATVETEIGVKNIGQLTEELAEIGAARMINVLADLSAFPPVPQPDLGILYAPKVDKSESRLDFLTSATQVVRQIRAFAPAAYFEHANERVRILEAEALITLDSARPGTVIDDALTIACNPGAIRPTLVQRAGRAIMTPADLLRGFAIPVGTRLT